MSVNFTGESNSTLGIKNYRDVYVAVKPVSPQWKDLGTGLGVSKPTLDIIEADHRGDVVECLSQMVTKWLRRDVHDGAAMPTWRSLCTALSPIDRALAEMIAVEHGCNYISPTVSEVFSKNSITPAFLPQCCGCGQCTIKGWMSGRECQNMYVDRRPALLVVNPDHPVATKFHSSYDRQATLYIETSQMEKHFLSISSETWKCLKKEIEQGNCLISDITLELFFLFKHPPPAMSSIQELQSWIHSLRVSWFNFAPLFSLAERFLSLHSDLMSKWNTYQTCFKEYCEKRNLKSFVNVFFQVEEQNVFILEVDECYYNFKLSDIKALRKSLSLALGVPAVCLHLVTVRGGSVVIYFYYCYSDYLIIFKSLTEEQLKMISEIKPYKILSLTDLHNQFRYDSIQSYNDDNSTELQYFPSHSVNDDNVQVKGLIKSYKEQLIMKDIELTRRDAEIQDQRVRLTMMEKERALFMMKERLIESHKKQLVMKDIELTRRDAEIQDQKMQLISMKEELAMSKRKIYELTRSNEEIMTLRNQLETERVLKKEAMEKLTQVMFQRQPGPEGGSSTEPSKAHEQEIRKIKGELQQETQKFKRVVGIYQQQLEEIQKQVIEEYNMRKELQTQLQQSEAKLNTLLQLGIGSGNYVGPSAETDGSSNNSSILPIQEHETLMMQVPKENNALEKGWRDMYVVLSYVAKKLILYEREEDMGTQASPYLMLEFAQIYSVRTLERGEHERVRVKPIDAKRVIQLTYEEESSRTKINPADEFEDVVPIRGHRFVEARNSSRLPCDVCSETLPLALLSGGIYECKGCQMKCHKDDVDKVDLILPCVMGEENRKKLLLLIRNDEHRSHWLSKLMSVIVGRDVVSTTAAHNIQS